VTFTAALETLSFYGRAVRVVFLSIGNVRVRGREEAIMLVGE
jgi:hypothetical protein